MNLNSTLASPEKPVNLPQEAQWLAGEGAGSWFYIMPKNEHYLITRYSPTGKIECESIFELTNKGFDVNMPYVFAHLSHCERVNIQQNSTVYLFKRIR